MVFVEPRHAAYLWEDAEHCFDRIAEFTPPFIEKQDVPEMVFNGRAQLWLFYTGGLVRFAGLTEMLIYPRAKVFSVIYGGGENVKAAVPFIDVVEEWARSRGCTDFLMEGRRGWFRYFKGFGYRESQRAYIVKSLRG